MKNVFKAVFVLLIMATILSCSKVQENQEQFPDLQTADEFARQEFAEILSIAVYNEPVLRTFIKSVALKQFDMDYDVFYPWTKDLVVDGNRTFRDILIQYDSKGLLETIETEEPKLTILVPDWSWVSDNCFSIKTWIPLNEPPAVSFEVAGNNAVYYNGKMEGLVPNGCFIDTPVLVVKSNERMVTNDVKSGSSEFCFLDPVFDRANNPETKDHDVYYEYNYSAPSLFKWVDKNSIDYKVSYCYEVMDGVPGGYHRDYIYYGMDASVSAGFLDNTMKETIYKFRIVYNNMPADDVYFESGDLGFQSHYYVAPNAPELSSQELKALNWGEGGLEFKFEINAGFVSNIVYYWPCSFDNAFGVTKVHERRRFNWLGALKSRLYYIDRDGIAPKWMTPDLKMFVWDVASVPNNYSIAIYEHDSGSIYTDSHQCTWTYMTNYTNGDEMGLEYSGLTYKTTRGFSQSQSNSTSGTETITYTDSDDPLGTFIVQYCDQVTTGASRSAVQLHSYYIGKVECIILPRHAN